MNNNKLIKFDDKLLKQSNTKHSILSKIINNISQLPKTFPSNYLIIASACIDYDENEIPFMKVGFCPITISSQGKLSLASDTETCRSFFPDYEKEINGIKSIIKGDIFYKRYNHACTSLRGHFVEGQIVTFNSVVPNNVDNTKLNNVTVVALAGESTTVVAANHALIPFITHNNKVIQPGTPASDLDKTSLRVLSSYSTLYLRIMSVETLRDNKGVTCKKVGFCKTSFLPNGQQFLPTEEEMFRNIFPDAEREVNGVKTLIKGNMLFHSAKIGEIVEGGIDTFDTVTPYSIDGKNQLSRVTVVAFKGESPAVKAANQAGVAVIDKQGKIVQPTYRII